MNKNWSNKYLELNAEINNLGFIPNSSPVEIRYKVNGKDIKIFKVINNDYHIVSFDNKTGKIKVDERMIANKILNDLYENNEIAPAFLSGESGKYLVDTAKDKNFYYEDNYIYDLYGLKSFREDYLSKYIDTLDDDYLKEVNRTLLRIIEDMSLDDSYILAHNDLHFEFSEEKNKDFGKAKPVYKCKSNKVNGLIKHVKNSLAKHNSLNIVDSKEFLNILKRKTKDNFSIDIMKDNSFYKLLKNDNSTVFDVLIEGNTASIYNNSNKNSKTFRFSQMEEILNYLNK